MKAVLTPKPGEANIAAAQVTLPQSEFLDNAHIQTVCTRVQFAAKPMPGGLGLRPRQGDHPAARQAPGRPVYLRSSGHKLPDLVAALNGQIDVALDGSIDTGKGGGIRNTFEVVPDAPVTKFALEMQGGNKGLLENSENLCGKKAKTQGGGRLHRPERQGQRYRTAGGELLPEEGWEGSQGRQGPSPRQGGLGDDHSRPFLSCGEGVGSRPRGLQLPRRSSVGRRADAPALIVSG